MLRSALIAITMLAGGAASGQTVWTGPPVTFTKPDFADWNLPENQDRITDNVWITRANFQGIYNIKVEGGWSSLSPADTEWAFGDAADYENLVFQSWVEWNGQCPPCVVNQDAVVHLISDDIYIDIKFLSWSCCGAGGFSYERSTAPVCLKVVDEEVVCHDDGSGFTYSVTGVDACTGGESSYVFVAEGGAPGEELCFTLLVGGDGGGFCCSAERCVTIPNCAQPPCDLDGDGVVGVSDVLILLTAWGTDPGGPPDYDADGTVGMADFLTLLGMWGEC